MGAPAHHHPPTDPQHDYELRAPVCVLPSHSPLKTSPASRRVAHVLKLQRRMTAGPREALARAAPAPDLYNPQARASVGADDLVIDAVGTLRGAWRRPSAAGLGAPVVGAGASEQHLAFPPRVQWFSQCLAMLSLGAVELVVPNTQGAGIMAPPFVSAEFLASALAMMLLLAPRLAGDRPVSNGSRYADACAPLMSDSRISVRRACVLPSAMTTLTPPPLVSI